MLKPRVFWIIFLTIFITFFLGSILMISLGAICLVEFNNGSNKDTLLCHSLDNTASILLQIIGSMILFLTICGFTSILTIVLKGYCEADNYYIRCCGPNENN